jgi:hypothetical protein
MKNGYAAWKSLVDWYDGDMIQNETRHADLGGAAWQTVCQSMQFRRGTCYEEGLS